MDDVPDLLIAVTDSDCRIARATGRSPLEVALMDRLGYVVLVNHVWHRLVIDGRVWHVCEDTIAADERREPYTAVLSPVDMRTPKPRDEGDYRGEMYDAWNERCKLDADAIVREGNRRLEPVE